MKFLHIKIIFLLLFLTNNSYAQVEVKNVYDYEKTHYSVSRTNKFEYDSLIQTYFYLVKVENNMKFISSISYKGKTVYTTFISDNKFRMQDNVIDSISIDSLGLDEMKSYFLLKYNTELSVHSLPKSFFDIGEPFGIACGGAALPRGRGKEYIKLLNKVENEEITALLISLDPFRTSYWLSFVLLRNK